MWSPHDFPFIVEKAWQGNLDLADRFRGIDLPEAREAEAGVLQSAATLSDPELLWLDTGICEMLAETGAPPAWSPETCIPGPHGLIGFEKPWVTVPYFHGMVEDESSDVAVSAIGWETRGDKVRITAWVHGDTVDRSIRSPLKTGLALEEIIGITIDLHEDVDTESITMLGTQHGAVRDAGFRLQDTIGAVWLLMAQPAVFDDTPAVARVRKKRGGVSRKMPVRVSVRSLTRRRATSSSGGGKRGKATSRWWVRGHWRQQPWGEGRKLRKPIYIAPHTAGAQDTEVDERPKVQVWRRGQK